MTNFSNHTLKHYDHRLDELLALITEMGTQVGKLAGLTQRALVERSDTLVLEGKAADKEINRLEGELERAATETLALQNPLAVDLRFVTSALKIASMLERAGDLAKNNIKRSPQLGVYQAPEIQAQLHRMAELFVSMMEDALVAVRERNAEKALDVWRRDDEVDALNRQVFAAAQAAMQANASAIPACTQLMFMAKNLERMADYVTNLAKTVHYVVTGTLAHKSLIRDG